MTTERSSIAALLLAANKTLAGSPQDDSLHDYHEADVGEPVSNEITLNVNNGTQSVNIFQLTRSVVLVSLYGIVTDATTLANLTAGHFNLFSGALDVDITKNKV